MTTSRDLPKWNYGHGSPAVGEVVFGLIDYLNDPTLPPDVFKLAVSRNDYGELEYEILEGSFWRNLQKFHKLVAWRSLKL